MLEKHNKYEVVWSNQWEPSTKTQHASDVYCARFGFENHSNDDISDSSKRREPSDKHLKIPHSY